MSMVFLLVPPPPKKKEGEKTQTKTNTHFQSGLARTSPDFFKYTWKCTGSLSKRNLTFQKAANSIWVRPMVSLVSGSVLLSVPSSFVVLLVSVSCFFLFFFFFLCYIYLKLTKLRKTILEKHVSTWPPKSTIRRYAWILGCPQIPR